MNSHKAYTTLFFDLDNTIFDFNIASGISFNKTLSHFNIHGENLYKIYKKYNSQIWHAFENKEIDSVTLRWKRFQLFLEHIDHLHLDPNAMNSYYLSQLVLNATPEPGARALLDRFKGNKKLVVITNGLKEVQLPRMKEHNFYHYFDAIVVSDEIGIAKPDTAYFDYAIKAAEVENRSEVLVIGDSLNSDIRGGIQSNLDTCWYNPKGLKNETEYQATYEISHLEELINIV